MPKSHELALIVVGISRHALQSHRKVIEMFESPRIQNENFGKRKMSRIVTKPTKWHARPAKTQISLGGFQV